MGTCYTAVRSATRLSNCTSAFKLCNLQKVSYDDFLAHVRVETITSVTACFCSKVKLKIYRLNFGSLIYILSGVKLHLDNINNKKQANDAALIWLQRANILKACWKYQLTDRYLFPPSGG